jgi:hypothetical protein
LDAFIDSGAMLSCCKTFAIPEYFWKPCLINVRSIIGSKVQINRIARNFPILIRGLTTHNITDIINKIRIECCSDRPDGFLSREQYFVDLPYAEYYKDFPQKATAHPVSPTEQERCKKEIEDLLSKGLIEKSKSPQASPTFYVNKHSE